MFGKTTSGSIPTQLMRSATSPSGTHATCPFSPVTASRIASSAVSYGRLPTRRTSLRGAPFSVVLMAPLQDPTTGAIVQAAGRQSRTGR